MFLSQNKITPEEKLLNLIENPKEAAASSAKATGRFKFPNFFKFDFTGILRALKNTDFRKINLRVTNKMLIAVSVLLTIFLFFYVSNEKKHVSVRFEKLKTKTASGKPLNLDTDQKLIPNYSSYTAETSQNNPFHMLPEVAGEKPVKLPAGTEFKLVGILWSDRSQAIIEDTTNQKTYMVYEGDTVDKYTVSKITQTEVKLKFEDGEKTLR